MANIYGTFDTPAAKEVSLEKVSALFNDFGVTRVYIKPLAPNDNSKNQPYFGVHLPDVAFLPSGEMVGSISTSAKEKKRAIKYQSELALSWFDVDGVSYPAPHAKLIYYPQYPEVRFSGFLKGSRVKAGEWMDPKKSGRSIGRWLLLGVAPDQTIYAYLVIPDCYLARELKESIPDTTSVFSQLDIEFSENRKLDTTSVYSKLDIESSKIREPKTLSPVTQLDIEFSKTREPKTLSPVSQLDTKITKTTSSESARQSLIRKLKEIHQQGWIPSQRLDKTGVPIPYKAPNGGGYTLEALLGIKPNGYAEPDYHGWEVKQFGVTDFPLTGAKVTTLFTPEPDGGIYTDPGFVSFMKDYGYPDRSGIVDRINFGGTHYFGKKHHRTDLTLDVHGFDISSSTINDPSGNIVLVDNKGKVAASWSFSKLMDHWKRKHAKAVYIPCLKKKEKSGIFYKYGNEVELGIGTGFEMLLSSIVNSSVYYDPGLKVEKVSTPKPVTKKRNQFRVKHTNLNALYNSYEFVDSVKDCFD